MVENSTAEQEDARFSKFEELPDELVALRNRVFQNQDDLLAAIEQLGFDNLFRVILEDDGKAYLFVPSDNHDKATSKIVSKFTNWVAGWKGWASWKHNIALDQNIATVPTPKKQRRLREPDICFWGEPKCERDRDNELEPRSANPPSMFPLVNPDVCHSIWMEEHYGVRDSSVE
jgi:hypothetical protein